MRFVDALKWTLLHRGISLVSLLLGLALAGAGIVLGFGEMVGTLVADPSNPGDALQVGNPFAALVLVTLGVVVWLVGKSYALYLTLPRATGQAAVDEFDMKQVRSEVLDALDERLSTIEDDLEVTRRSVAELKRREHAAAFDEDEVLKTPGTESPTTDGRSTRNSENTSAASISRTADDPRSTASADTATRSTSPTESATTDEPRSTGTAEETTDTASREESFTSEPASVEGESSSDWEFGDDGVEQTGKNSTSEQSTDGDSDSQRDPLA